MQKYCNLSRTPSVVQFIKTSKGMLRQGADPLGVKNVKMINRHVLQFEKYNTNNRDLIQQPLTYLVDVVFA